jgi:diguanylate cyclase (GGDEF)-like protein
LLKALLIDDDPFTVRPLERVLISRGYDVLTENHGKTAWETILREKPDLVVSDMLLPGLHGLELLDLIRRTPELGQTRVVLITGVFKALKYKAESQQLGADLFLLKPLQLDSFLQEIDRLMGQSAPKGKKDLEGSIYGELQEEFRAFLEKTLLEIQALVPMAEKRLGSALKDMQMKVHMLAGSAGNFGYPQMTDMARGFDLRLQQLLSDGQQEPGELAGMLRSLRGVGGRIEENPATLLPEEAPKEDKSHPVWVFGSPASHLAIKEALVGLSYRVQHLSSLEVAEKNLQGVAPVLVMELPEDREQAFALLDRLPTHRVWTAARKLYFVAEKADFQLHLKAIRAGCSGFFLKPLRSNQIIDALEKGDLIEMGKGKVLLVDDDEILSRQFKKILDGAGLKTHVLNHAEKVLETLQEFPPDLILLDLYMPECDGFELARMIRQSPSYLGVPIIFLSVESGMDRQLEAFRQGVDDYLFKPIKSAHLISVVRSRIARFREIRTNMVRDSLTGLLNHSSGIERLESEISRARRSRSDLTVFILDLDFFKNINDTYGHLAGDKVLQSLSFLLQKRLRVTDIIARYGGEEFLIVLPETKQTRAYGILDQVREDFSRMVHEHEDFGFTCTFSAGSTTWEPGMSASDVIANADSALYRAKKEGRNRIREA